MNRTRAEQHETRRSTMKRGAALLIQSKIASERPEDYGWAR